MTDFIERGSPEFEKISNFVQTDLSDVTPPIPYKQVIKSISDFEKRVSGKMQPPAKLSDAARLQLIRRMESFFAIRPLDGTDVIVETPESKRRPKWWSAREDKEEGYYLGSYLRYLRRDPATVNMRNEQAIKRDLERTDLVMDRLFDPQDSSVKLEDRRGLVMGNVQSGKTANYSMLISKAADAGFRFIIVLTGTIELLRQQTQSRLDESFVGEKSDGIDGANNITGVGNYRAQSEFKEKLPISMTSIATDFRCNQRKALQPLNLANTKSPIILVVKKNTTALREIQTWLNGNAGQTKQYPILMIDDEADAASVSSKGSEDPTVINRLIREILDRFDKRAYVGYTATPFANIFIDPLYNTDGLNDLYPRDFMISLAAPSNYIGAKKVFGGPEDEYSDFLIPIYDWEQEFPWTQKNAESALYANRLPASLQDAIRLFMLNICVRDLRGYDDKHNSMLVHVSRLTAVHDKVLSLITDFVRRTANDVISYAGAPESSVEYINTIKPFKQLFENMQQIGYKQGGEFFGKNWATNKDYGCFKWADVLKHLSKIASTIFVGGAFSTKKKEIVYPKDQRVNVIAVGGNTLARGFTLENLSVSYFTRNTIACDTLLQMGRWFGYRTDYDDLCRIFMPEDCIKNFKYATLSSEDLVKNINQMNEKEASPSEFLLTIATHPASQLVLTAVNKSRNAVYNEGVRLDGDLVENASVGLQSRGVNLNNKQEILEHVKHFISVMLQHNQTPETDDEGILWRDVDSGDVIDFILGYPIDVQVKYNSDFFKSYLKANSDLKWDVGVINRPYANPNKKKPIINIQGLEICKSRRSYRKDSDNNKVSMSIKDDECIGLGYTPDKKRSVDNLRAEARRDRKKPLLIINIVDVYMDKDSAEISMEDVPLITVTFPGSFNNPITKPVYGAVWNQKVKSHLEEDFNESEDE